MLSQELPLSLPYSRDASARNALIGSKPLVNGSSVGLKGVQATQIDLDHQRWLETCKGDAEIIVDGISLELIDLVAPARDTRVKIGMSKDAEILDRIQASVDLLNRHVEEGNTVYGVTTGLGGSADTRTKKVETLQRAITQHQNTGILTRSDRGLVSASIGSKSHALSREVVRGAMVARCNTLMRGQSAVRIEVIEKILVLLRLDMIPVIPLRGSISASGDLSPLSYIAGALEGNPDISVQCGGQHNHATVSANQALELAGISPVTLGPKEGLGLLNGTAVSCSAAALALYDAQNLTLMTQVLTAMATEALLGTGDTFDPFISAARPHVGQKEVTENLSAFLYGSKLATGRDTHKPGLYQDRYALRTAPQWIGPQLEDLALARQQLTIELNSTTDNPLIDVGANVVHHGGNFQAASVTSAMEKTRLSLQMLGKLMFAQHAELVNPQMNKNLPPNLCFDEPSLSFTFKGVDINMAAYMSELGFLTNPVSSHVQSAEMHNQSVNSLALISARYTAEAAEVVAMMASAHLYALCQALDLQAMHAEFVTRLEPSLLDLFRAIFCHDLPHPLDVHVDFHRLFAQLLEDWSAHKNLDTGMRISKTVDLSCGVIFNLIASLESHKRANLLQRIDLWRRDAWKTLDLQYLTVRQEVVNGDGSKTLEKLGKASAVMYRFVRKELGVAIHKGLVEQPTYDGPSLVEGVSVKAEDKRTIGSQISIIYEALRDGRMHDALVDCLGA